MADYNPKTQREALKRFMAKRGLNPYAWAEKAGVREGTIRNFLAGRSQSMNARTWHKLAEAESVSVDQILSEVDEGNNATSTEPKLDSDFPTSQNASPALMFGPGGGKQPAFSTNKIPLLGVAMGGDRGDFLMSGEIVGYALRPLALESIKDVYGILIRGESMQPRWFPGEPVFANPNKEPRAGDFVIVQLRAKNGEREGLVKQLVKRDATHIHLQALNPPGSKPFKIAVSDVISCHRVYRQDELHGV